MKSATLQQVFYYHFKTNWIWLLLTLLLFFFMLHCVFCYPAAVFWWQTWSLFGCCVYSFALWAFKYLCRHKMAVIDDKYIKIDHNRPLPWRAVAFAELKAPGMKPRALQVARHRMLRELGFKVYVIDGIEQIGGMLNEITG